MPSNDPETDRWDQYARKLMPPVDAGEDWQSHWKPWAMAIARDAWNAGRSEDRYGMLLDWRGIEPNDACPRCGGAGIYAYGNTSTWRHGIGGQSITSDVCDKCWGSGSLSRPWTSWRQRDGK